MKAALLLLIATSLAACSINTQNPSSTIEMKITCREYGEENYQFRDFEGGYSEFRFYYSPILDTCVGEREDWVGARIDYGMFDMFKGNTGKWLFEYSNQCEGEDCLTLSEYQKKKNKLLGE